MLTWHLAPKVKAEALGLLPLFLSDNDPRPAQEQLHANYLHGGGFQPFSGFTLVLPEKKGEAYLSYPGDPPMRELGRVKLRDELIIMFEYSWVAVVQPSGEYVIARMD